MIDLDTMLRASMRDYLDKLRAKKPREPKAAKPKKRANPERDLQRSIVALIRRCAPSIIVAAVPNEQAGSGKTPDERARFGAARKASGVLTGHPDLIIYLPQGRTLLWELKAAKGTTSDAQRELHDRLRCMGHPVAVIRSMEEAEAALIGAGVVLSGRLRIAAPVEPMR